MSPPRLTAALASIALLGGLPPPDAGAQRAERYAARLAPTPRDTSMRATIAGRGAVEATLVGRELTLSGSFEGLAAPATQVRIHHGAATAVRGPAVHTLDLARAPGGTAGAISGAIELDEETLAALRAGQLYIQVDSEVALDGNLWGWLLR